MSDDSTGQYSFGGDSAERYLFLGAIITIVTDGTATDGSVTVTEIDAPPGYENNLHTHPPNELFYVLDGEMTLYVDRKPYHLTTGMTGFVPANRPHGFRVVGDTPLHVLAIFVPAGMAGFFRDVGTPIETLEIPDYHGPTEEELERMMAASPRHDMKRLGPLPRPT
ncbi:cupin domain-containing protein [Halorubrum sp. HHNYT27]|uniref:cupin domain-containing protein n=1 Tax=Halorubrum sp. HHNYT27 TaxID=3402275 RepID=UPI003EB9E4A7